MFCFSMKWLFSDNNEDYANKNYQVYFINELLQYPDMFTKIYYWWGNLRWSKWYRWTHKLWFWHFRIWGNQCIFVLVWNGNRCIFFTSFLNFCVLSNCKGIVFHLNVSWLVSIWKCLRYDDPTLKSLWKRYTHRRQYNWFWVDHLCITNYSKWWNGKLMSWGFSG